MHPGLPSDAPACPRFSDAPGLPSDPPDLPSDPSAYPQIPRPLPPPPLRCPGPFRRVPSASLAGMLMRERLRALQVVMEAGDMLYLPPVCVFQRMPTRRAFACTPNRSYSQFHSIGRTG